MIFNRIVAKIQAQLEKIKIQTPFLILEKALQKPQLPSKNVIDCLKNTTKSHYRIIIIAEVKKASPLLRKDLLLTFIKLLKLGFLVQILFYLLDVF